MLKIETLLLRIEMDRYTKDGESSMLMSMRRSLPRVNSTRSSDSSSIGTSILFLKCPWKMTNIARKSKERKFKLVVIVKEDILILTASAIETWPSRFQMGKSIRYGTSINHL